MSFAVDSIILPFLVVPPQSLPILPSFRRKKSPTNPDAKNDFLLSLSRSHATKIAAAAAVRATFSLSLSGLGDSVA